MVYPGRPSRGCSVCRKRRIKCDEAVPGCTYCLKKKIPCPGYKSLFDVAWRDQNHIAESSVRRRKNASGKAQLERSAKGQLMRLPSSKPRVSLSEDYEAYAVNFFFSSYILLPKEPGISRGFLDCLYPIWVRTDSQSPLKPAVVAVASCLLEAWSLIRPDAPLSLSRTQYTKGVSALRKSLQIPFEAGDDVIMAALMLDMYEGLQFFFVFKPNRSPHIQGAVALVEQRKRLPCAAKLSQRVVLGTRNHLVGRALNQRESVPSSTSDWPDNISQIAVTPGILLDELAIDVANLQALTSRLDCGTACSSRFVSNACKKAIELDQRLIAWAHAVPSDWIPVKVSGVECIPPTVLDIGLYQDYCHVYKSIFIAYAFNSYYCLRIRLQISMAACLRNIEFVDNKPTSGAILETIQDLADAMCASVPYHLGDRTTIARIGDKSVHYPHIIGHFVSEEHIKAASAYGGWFLATRLLDLLSFGKGLREGQCRWIAGQMARIAKIYAVQLPATLSLED